VRPHAGRTGFTPATESDTFPRSLRAKLQASRAHRTAALLECLNEVKEEKSREALPASDKSKLFAAPTTETATFFPVGHSKNLKICTTQMWFQIDGTQELSY